MDTFFNEFNEYLKTNKIKYVVTPNADDSLIYNLFIGSASLQFLFEFSSDTFLVPTLVCFTSYIFLDSDDCESEENAVKTETEFLIDNEDFTFSDFELEYLTSLINETKELIKIFNKIQSKIDDCRTLFETVDLDFDDFFEIKKILA